MGQMSDHAHDRAPHRVDDGPYASAAQARAALRQAPFGVDDTSAQIEVAIAEALKAAGLRDSMTGYEQDATTRLARLLVADGTPETAQIIVGWIRRAATPGMR